MKHDLRLNVYIVVVLRERKSVNVVKDQKTRTKMTLAERRPEKNDIVARTDIRTGRKRMKTAKIQKKNTSG